MSQNEKRTCPSCGAAVVPGDVYCIECGTKLTAKPVTEQQQETTPQKQEMKEPIKEKNPEMIQLEMVQKKLKRWIWAFLILFLVAGVGVAVLWIQLDDATYEAEKWERRYENLDEEYTELEVYRDLAEYNGLTGLYQIQIDTIRNVTADGEFIGNALEEASLDHVQVVFSATDERRENRWAEPLEGKIYKSGEVIEQWNGSIADDNGSKTTVQKTATTDIIQEKGTYVLEFYHKGWVVCRYEFTVK